MSNIEDDYTEKIRTADEVAHRCIVLYAFIAAGHDEPRDELVAWLNREGLWNSVSPKEAALLLTESPTKKQKDQATWRVEALFPLLWALGKIDELPPPTDVCDVPFVRHILPPLFSSVAEFISSAHLREEDEIYEANEDIYQIHCSVIDVYFHGKPIPDGYNTEVVEERHYALNWLIGYWGQEWDDITTDT